MMNSLQIDVINGTMLGDATIKKEGRYRFKQCIANYEYVEHVREILLPWSTHIAKCLCKRPNNVNGKVLDNDFWDGTYLESCYFFTKTDDIFKNLRNKWYKEGKKIVPKDLEFNPRMISYWFMDDGSNNPKKRQAYFATECFCNDDVDFLSYKLDVLGIKNTQQKDGNGKHKTAVSCKCYFDFIEMISPFIVNCMSRKIDLSKAIRPKKGWFPNKLNKIKAREIRKIYYNGNYTQKYLADKYGVSLTTIQRVLSDKIYQENGMSLKGSAEVLILKNQN